MTTSSLLQQNQKSSDNEDKNRQLHEAHESQSRPKENRTRDRSGKQERLQQWLKLLSKCNKGRFVIEFAQTRKIQIVLDSKTKDFGAFNPKDKKTIVSSRISTGDAVSTILHELRHANQYEDGYWQSTALSPMDCILMSCAQEADAEAFSVAGCWELKMAGYPQAFEAHKKSPYGDISRAFEKMATENPQSIEDGSAMRVAYDHWFANERRVISYAAGALDCIWKNVMIYDSHKVQRGLVPLDRVLMKDIGILPDGQNYQDVEGRDLTDKMYRQIKHPRLIQFLTIIERSLNLTPTISNDNQPTPEPLAMDIRAQLRQIHEEYSPKMRRLA